MSEEVRIGEFSIDPESIPEAQEFPTKQNVVLEVKSAERKEKVDEASALPENHYELKEALETWKK